MRWGEFLKAYIIVGCFAAITSADFADTQPKEPAATKDTFSPKIKCKPFQKDSDEKGSSSSDATIGKMAFSRHTFGVGEVNIGGADLAIVLNRKCRSSVKKRP